MIKKRLLKIYRSKIARSHRGFTLLEVIAAVVIVSILSLSIYLAVSTSTKVLVLTNTDETAKDLASSDMEWIRGQLYSSSYTLPAPAYANYSHSVVVTFLRTNEQRIDITITWGGKTVFTLTDFRVNY